MGYPKVAGKCRELVRRHGNRRILTLHILTLSGEEKPKCANGTSALAGSSTGSKRIQNTLLRFTEPSAIAPNENASGRDAEPVGGKALPEKCSRAPALNCVPATRVRLRSRKTADILKALRGQIGVVECIEQDYESISPSLSKMIPAAAWERFVSPAFVSFSPPAKSNRSGNWKQKRAARRGPAHETPPFRVLIAGIGDIFLGEGAFGVEVIRRLANKLPTTMCGIRGLELAYALMDDYEAVILVDRRPRNGPPGTLYTIEPDLKSLESPDFACKAHTLDPVKVSAFAQATGLPGAKIFGANGWTRMEGAK